MNTIQDVGLTTSSIQDVVTAINATRTTGTIFSVNFVKTDGTERTLVGRLGVKCHLVGSSARRVD